MILATLHNYIREVVNEWMGKLLCVWNYGQSKTLKNCILTVSRANLFTTLTPSLLWNISGTQMGRKFPVGLTWWEIKQQQLLWIQTRRDWPSRRSSTTPTTMKFPLIMISPSSKSMEASPVGQIYFLPVYQTETWDLPRECPLRSFKCDIVGLRLRWLARHHCLWLGNSLLRRCIIKHPAVGQDSSCINRHL